MAVREEQLGLADAARVEQQLAGRRVARRVLGADAELAVAPRDPVRLAAPAAVDDPVVERQDRAERRDGARRVRLLEAGAEGEAGGDDLERAGRTLPRRDPVRERRPLVVGHLRQVPERHRPRVDGDRPDQRRLRLDLRGSRAGSRRRGAGSPAASGSSRGTARSAAGRSPAPSRRSAPARLRPRTTAGAAGRISTASTTTPAAALDEDPPGVPAACGAG